MSGLAAIIFDFDGVIADCRHGVLLEGAARFVREAALRVPIGVASGAMSHEVEEILRAHDLLDLFGAIIDVDRAVRSKPSPEPFLAALRRLEAGTPEAGHGAARQFEPGRVVAIDDSVSGLIAARTAGLRSVGVAAAERRAGLAAHAELIVPGLQALTLDTLDTLVRTVRS